MILVKVVKKLENIIKNKMIEKINKCVMCGKIAGYKDPEHNEDLCRGCFLVNEDILIQKRKNK